VAQKPLHHFGDDWLILDYQDSVRQVPSLYQSKSLSLPESYMPLPSGRSNQRKDGVTSAA
jgi:hypothetical protein